MNTKRAMRWMSTAALCAVLMVAGACSKVETSLLDTVPKTAPVVAVINADMLLKCAGCQVSGDAVQLTPQLQKFAGMPAEASSVVASSLRMFADLYGAIDMNEVVFVGIDPGHTGNDQFFTFKVSDRSAVVSKMEALGVENTGSDGVDVYVGDDWTVALRDAQGWLIPAGTDSDKARSYFTAPDRKESIGAQTGIADFLHTDNAVNIAVLTSGLSDNKVDGDRRACIGVRVEDSVIGMRMQLISPDGSVSDFASGFQEIDTGFLRYVPGSYIGAAAVGLTSSFDWSAVGTFAAMAGGRDAATIAQMAMPVLSKIDGTLAVAAGPAGGAPAIADINLKTWNFLIMAHMAQADVDATLSQIGIMASQLGASPIAVDADPANVSAWRLPDGTELYAGNVDGYLALSNRELNPDGENLMTDTFESMRAALAVSIPAGGEVVKAFNLPFGFNASVQCQEASLDVRFSLNGTGSSVLQSLLELMD